MNNLDVAVHVIQVGGGFAPWSALGYVSDLDLIRLFVASTPTGLYIQDHHITAILEAGLSAIDEPNHVLTVGNLIQRAWLFRPSGLTPVRSLKASHMPFEDVSYQSSLLVKKDLKG